MDALEAACELGRMFGADVQASGHPGTWSEIVVGDREIPPCDRDDLEHRFGAITDAMTLAYISGFRRTFASINDS